jgi:chitodextrinase
LGFGEGDEATVLVPGRTTYYFRRQITLPADRVVTEATLGLLRDDGAIVYVNGVEVCRSNMPAGPVTADTRAATATTGQDESRWYEAAVDRAAFAAGVNVVAVEVHQISPASSDISFDLHLEAELGEIVFDDVTAPSRPVALVAEARTATRVMLSWGAASDDVGVVGYRVFVNGLEVGSTSKLAFLVRDLLPETEYRFKVFAFDAAGNVSPRSRIVKATTFADTSRPSRPRHTTLTPLVDSIVIDWDPASDNVGISHYLLKSGGVVLGTTTDTSWLMGGLEPGTEYAVALWAFDTSGNRSRRVLRRTTTLTD